VQECSSPSPIADRYTRLVHRASRSFGRDAADLPESIMDRETVLLVYSNSVRVLSEPPRQSETPRRQRREIGSNLIWRVRFCLLQRFFVLSFQPERPSILKYGSTLADSDRSRGIRFVRSNSAISICVQQRIGVALLISRWNAGVSRDRWRTWSSIIDAA